MKLKALLRGNYRELIFVVLAFTVMVSVSIIFASRIVSKRISANAFGLLDTAETVIMLKLRDAEITVHNTSILVVNRIEDGHGVPEIQNFFRDITGKMDLIQVSPGFLAIYGYIMGSFIDGTGYELPEDIDPETRQWYTEARRAHGGIILTFPYYNAATGKIIVTAAGEIRGKAGEDYGVIALDIDLEGIANYVTDLRFMEGGYGILFDENFFLIGHPEKDYAGKRFMEISPYHDLDFPEGENTVILMDRKTSQDESMVSYYRRLENGWILGIVTPRRAYFLDVYSMAVVLSLIGFICMTVLSYFLLRLSAAKVHSELENREKTSFLAEVSHEIRTPMNAIMGMAELISRQPVSGEVAEYVTIIRQAGNTLLALINDILEFSKLESGRLYFESREYSPVSLINDVSNIIRIKIANKPISFHLNLDPDIPAVLVGDDVKIRQILVNLLSNAVKYTRKGHIILNVRKSFLKTSAGQENAGEDVPETPPVNFSRENEKLRLIIEVEDTGIGIRKEDLGRLFTSFTRLDRDVNRGIEGTGLGLAIVKAFCTKMGGAVNVRSEYGEGSIFTAEVLQGYRDRKPVGPVSMSDSIPARENKIHEYGSRFTAPEVKILIVDDMETNLLVAKGLMAPYRMQIDTCPSGPEAIEMMRLKSYDLVFMDHMMPGMDGIAAAAGIHDINPAVPVVMLTANVSAEQRKLFLAGKIDDFLAKPIEVSKLDEILEKWIPGEKQRRGERGSPPQNKSAEISSPGVLPKIEGLDRKLALFYAGGSPGAGRKILTVFCRDMEERLNSLREAVKTSDLENLAMQFHAIRSASRNVGALEISDAASILEEESGSGKWENAEDKSIRFIEDLEKLVKKIREALDS
ncbi:MAG: response regulator [Treponema sp.]|jgi:signal transduction histidine kinase/HPt (histidine-containing phosphotransfer) domain-containing protein/ActR/RegA family two-component response regulator|nr:response regulator [Treponema sp.]